MVGGEANTPRVLTKGRHYSKPDTI